MPDFAYGARRSSMEESERKEMTLQPNKARPLFDAPIVRRAIGDSFKKLDPRHQVKNPVMFVVEVGSLLTTVLAIQALLGQGEAPAGFIIAISLWLWFTVVFANFAEAMAEGRGKAQADTLRKSRRDINAKKLAQPTYGAAYTATPSGDLRKDDVVLIEAGEIALNILLAALTIIFLLVCATLLPFSLYSIDAAKQLDPNSNGQPVTVTVLVALLVCLIPTTVGGLLSAIGIAGMDRMIQANVIVMSGRAVEAAGDVDVLLLDKTGTITLGNRQATAFIPADGTDPKAMADAAQLASLADETPEGRSIVVLAKDKYGLRGREFSHRNPIFIPVAAQTRMSGVDLDGLQD